MESRVHNRCFTADKDPVLVERQDGLGTAISVCPPSCMARQEKPNHDEHMQASKSTPGRVCCKHCSVGCVICDDGKHENSTYVQPRLPQKALASCCMQPLRPRVLLLPQLFTPTPCWVTVQGSCFHMPTTVASTNPTGPANAKTQTRLLSCLRAIYCHTIFTTSDTRS